MEELEPFEPMENADPPRVKPVKLGSSRIVVDGNIDQSPDADIGFEVLDDHTTENPFSSPTRESEIPHYERMAEKTEEDYRQEISEAEKPAPVKMEDIQEISQIIINIVDMVVVSGLRWWAGDVSDTPYEIKQRKKDLIIDQLSRLLIKYNTAMSLEFLFFATIITAYLPSFMLARKNRAILKKTPEVGGKKTIKMQKVDRDTQVEPEEVFRGAGIVEPIPDAPMIFPAITKPQNGRQQVKSVKAKLGRRGGTTKN